MLVDVVASGGALILSGAGLSTESGIPDYRGPTGLARRSSPMTYQTFTGSAAARRRYWARSYLGWRHIARAVPNDGHRAVAELSRRGLLTGIITQNVDGLHQAAGPVVGGAAVTELHGSLHRVVCLSCGQRTSRARTRPAARGRQPRLGRGAGHPGQSRRGRRPGRGGHRVVPGRRLFRVPRRAQARRGVLRRERAQAAGAGLLRAGRKVQRAGGPGLVAHRDVRVPVRPARGQAAAPDRDRQPGRHPGRRLRHRDPRGSAGPDPDRARGAAPRAPEAAGWVRPSARGWEEA